MPSDLRTTAVKRGDSAHRFGDALRTARVRSALTQKKVAELSGLHRTYISQLERGLKSPTLDAVERLASALGMNPHDLVKAATRARL